MKTSKLVYVLAVIFLFGLILTAVAALITPPKIAAGSWREVCCGSMCPGGDHCLGTGTLKCCKEEPVPET